MDMYEIKEDEFMPETNTDDCCAKSEEKKKIDWKDLVALGTGICAEAVISSLLKEYVPISGGFMKRLIRGVGIGAITSAVGTFIYDQTKKECVAAEEVLTTIKVTIDKINDDEEVVIES